ncbi:MAG TPA: CapA family protein [Thermomicrobiales bacterium]|jgi:poly-gamma-glutamate synthesis protein (capsule biosynthesis protein)
MTAHPFSRRVFLTSLSTGALALLAACGGAPPVRDETANGVPSPQVPQAPAVRIATVDGAVAQGFARDLVGYLTAQLPQQTVELGAATVGAQVVISTSAPTTADAQTKLTRLYAPVTNWRLPLRNITRADLNAILTGKVTDWAQLGSPVGGKIVRCEYTPGGAVLPPELGQAIPVAAAYESYDLIVSALEGAPAAFAIVPLDVIDFRVQALAIDGLDPLAGRGDLAAYPLKQDLWLSWDPGLGSGLRDAINAFATAQGYWTDLAATRGNPVNVTVAGDIIFGRTVHSRMVQYNDFAHPLRKVAPRLRDADLTIANLECSMSDNTEKPDDPFTFMFTTNAAAVEGLVLAGIDGVSLANNHSMNFGKLGLSDTLAGLAANKITAFGGGMNLAEARKPGLFTVKGVSFAFLGYDGITAEDYGAGPNWAGTCPLQMDLVLEDLARAKGGNPDFIIPYFHWSEEYVSVPSPLMRRIAHQAIDNGAAMVLGSHPHWVQGTEWYKGKPILYSLGNFVFDQDWSEETKQGMFAEIVIRNKKIARVRLVPVLIEDYNQPRILGINEAMPVLQRVYDATDEIKTMG